MEVVKSNPVLRRRGLPMNERDLSRVREFRQLNRAMQGSNNQLIVGIDVAKERHHAFLSTAGGKTLVKTLDFGNSSGGFCEPPASPTSAVTGVSLQ
jgi:hypothetical protein